MASRGATSVRSIDDPRLAGLSSELYIVPTFQNSVQYMDRRQRHVYNYDSGMRMLSCIAVGCLAGPLDEDHASPAGMAHGPLTGVQIIEYELRALFSFIRAVRVVRSDGDIIREFLEVASKHVLKAVPESLHPLLHDHWLGTAEGRKNFLKNRLKSCAGQRRRLERCATDACATYPVTDGYPHRAEVEDIIGGPLKGVMTAFIVEHWAYPDLDRLMYDPGGGEQRSKRGYKAAFKGTGYCREAMSQGRIFASNPLEGVAPTVIGADAAAYLVDAGETPLKYPLLDRAKVLAMQQSGQLSEGGSDTSVRTSLVAASEVSIGRGRSIKRTPQRRSMRSSTPMPVVELASDTGECSLRCKLVGVGLR